tara:strand:+ start:208 stop:1074 length:867 start_codon:yes stop_codon:yes gene_type:complete
MNILIFGGNRFFGKSLLEKISKNNNYNIYVVNRGNLKTRSNTNITFIKSDRHDYLYLNKELDRISFDYIIDNSCYNLKDINFFYKHLYSKGHYIFASTVMTYMDGAFKFRIKENQTDRNIKTKFLQKQYKKKEIEYALNKKKVENFIKRNFSNYTILRLHNVIGANDFKDITYNLLNYKFNSKPKLKKNYLQICYDKDLVDIYMKMINKKIKGKNIFNVANEPIEFNKFYNKVNRIAKLGKIKLKKIKTFPLPQNMLMNNEKISKKMNFNFTKYEKILKNLLIKNINK